MLFLGTAKYPVENAYKSLVNKHGGHTNASTSMDMTVYQFDLAAAEHYEAALDVFAQFFIGASCVFSVCVRRYTYVCIDAWLVAHDE